MNFIEKSIFPICYFDPGVIWGRVRHRKSFFVIENLNVYKQIDLFFDLVIDLLIDKSNFGLKTKSKTRKQFDKVRNIVKKRVRILAIGVLKLSLSA